jgi:hypothetical protein
MATLFLSNLQFPVYYHSSGVDTISGYSSSEFYSLKNVCTFSSMYFQMLLPQVPALGLLIHHTYLTRTFPSFCKEQSPEQHFLCNQAVYTVLRSLRQSNS